LPSTKGTKRIEVTISIRANDAEPQGGEGGWRVIKRADTALYRAKHGRRNRGWFPRRLIAAGVPPDARSA